MNRISNRVLLCGPCNRLESNPHTLSGLRSENRKRRFMGNRFLLRDEQDGALQRDYRREFEPD